MSTLKKVLAWIALSSKDPNKVSLMVKGALTGAVVYVVWWASFFGYSLDPAQLGGLVKVVSDIVELALTAVALGATAWGLLRKVWATIKGKNEVLNQF